MNVWDDENITDSIHATRIKKFYPNVAFLFGKVLILNAQGVIGINVIVLQHLVYSGTVNHAPKLNTESFP